TIKLRALLHIQKFEEWDGNSSGFNSPGSGGSWKPVGPAPVQGNSGNDEGGKFFIQKGSRMNNGSFDEGFDEETPF
ncbi:MAG TPA: replicative DNA helicase, partial [Panacibacter sp.]|nr:replicative DNA helicase [Panacibacter sp.]